MPESVGMQRKRTTQRLADFFEPVVQIPYKVFYIPIIGGLSFQLLLIPNREDVAVLS